MIKKFGYHKIGVSIVLTNIQEYCLMPIADSIKEEKKQK